MTVALSCSAYRQYGMTMKNSMVPPSKEDQDDCGYVGTSLCEAFRIASSSSAAAASLRSRSSRRERQAEEEGPVAPEVVVAKTALSEALRAAAEVTEIEATALRGEAALSLTSWEQQAASLIDLAPRRPLRSSLDDDLNRSDTDVTTIQRPPSTTDSILKTSMMKSSPDASLTSVSSHSSAVRRQLSFGNTDTVEFDASLPACFAIDRPVTRWRSSRRGLERSHSSDCLPRLPARHDRAMMAPRRCARRRPEASPRMPQRVDEAFPFRGGGAESAILLSPTRTFDSPRSPHQSPTPSSPRLGLVRMDSA